MTDKPKKAQPVSSVQSLVFFDMPESAPNRQQDTTAVGEPPVFSAEEFETDPFFADEALPSLDEEETGVKNLNKASASTEETESTVESVFPNSLPEEHRQPQQAEERSNQATVHEEVTRTEQRPTQHPSGARGEVQADPTGGQSLRDLPMPWSRYVDELKQECMHEADPRLRALYLHEIADVLRMTGDRWQGMAAVLDQQALSMHAGYWPAKRSGWVERLRANDRNGYLEDLRSTLMQASSEKDTQDRSHPNANVLGELQMAVGLLYEEEGADREAREEYIKATRVGRGHPLFFLNLARLFASSKEFDALRDALSATAALAGEGPAADAIRGIVLTDIGELLRRADRPEEALAYFREASSADPMQMEAYRGVQLVAWQLRDLDLEKEGARGYLGLLIHEGRHVVQNAAWRRYLKRKTSGQLYQLGRMHDLQGASGDATASLLDALTVGRQEVFYARGLERVANRGGDVNSVQDALQLQLRLTSDVAHQTLLLALLGRGAVEGGDLQQAREHLMHCLRVNPSCLPALVDLGRIMLLEGDFEGQLMLWKDTLPAAATAESAERAWRRGNIHEYLRNDRVSAAAEYGEAMRRHRRGAWLRGLERCLLYLEDHEGLAAFYEESLQGAVDLSERRELLLSGVRHAQAHNQTERAISLMLELVEIGEVDLTRLEELAHLYREQGWYTESLQLFAEVVELGQEAIKSASMEGGEEEEALKDMVVRSLRWLAHLYESTKQLEEADTIYQRLLLLRPGDQGAVEAWRKVLEGLGKWRRLVEMLFEQVRYAPCEERQRTLWMESIEVCLERLQDHHRGKELLRWFCARFPDDINGAETLDALLRGREEWGELANALLSRAEQARRRGEEGEGLRLAYEAALLRRERLSDEEGCLEAMQVALSMKPDFIPALRSVTEILHSSRRYRELVEHYEMWRQREVGRGVWLPLTSAQAYVHEYHLGEVEKALALHVDILEAVHDSMPVKTSLLAAARLCQKLGLKERQLQTLQRLAERIAGTQEARGLLLYIARSLEARGYDASMVYQRMLSRDAEDSAARRGMERCLERSGDGARQVSYYLERAKSANKEQRVHYLVKIASVYLSMGKLKDASGLLRQVTVNEPGHVGARLMHAELAHKIGEWETAVRLERELAASTKNEAQRLNHLYRGARVYVEQLKRPVEAEPLLWEIVTLDPNYKRAFAILWGLYSERVEKRGRLLDLVDVRLGSLKEKADRVLLLREAVELAQSVDMRRARGYLERLLEEVPEDAESLAVAADLAQRQGDDAAMDYMQRWLRCAPVKRGKERADRLYRLAKMKVEREPRSEEALAHLEELLLLNATHSPGLRLMAETLLEFEQPERACRLYKDLFELAMASDLPLIIARLLDERLGRRQEALNWYLRAQESDPLGKEAFEGVVSIIDHARSTSQGRMGVRMVRDRLDWLAECHEEAIGEDPWNIPLYLQLARTCLLRGDHRKLRDLSGVLVYFGMANEAILRAYSHYNGAPELLLEGKGGRLKEDVLRRCVWPAESSGFRRRLFRLLWESVAIVDSDELEMCDRSRGQRELQQREHETLCRRVNGMASALGVQGYDVYVHPSDPYAVQSLFVPMPTLVIGARIWSDPRDVGHHFRVAAALEMLRDGQGLVIRPDARELLAALDELLGDALGGHPALPVFDQERNYSGVWGADATRRLQRALGRSGRRARRSLRSVLDARPKSLEHVDRWIRGCREAPMRVGLAVCGGFGSAADVVGETSFSLDLVQSPERCEKMVGVLREGRGSSAIEAMLRFVLSKEHSELRQELGVQPSGQ